MNILFKYQPRLGHNPGLYFFFQYFSRFGVIFNLAMRDIVIGFVQRVKINNFAGNFSFHDFPVRSFQNTELIESGVNGQMDNQTDIGAFRSLDRANSSVVG